jgi:hypothetical protein
MAALTESIAVDSSSVNPKETLSDSQQNGSTCQAISNKNPETNDENSCSTEKSAEDVMKEENENKPKFIEAPIPKVNPWTVNRNVPQQGGPLKPSARHFLGKALRPICLCSFPICVCLCVNTGVRGNRLHMATCEKSDKTEKCSFYMWICKM